MLRHIGVHDLAAVMSENDQNDKTEGGRGTVEEIDPKQVSRCGWSRKIFQFCEGGFPLFGSSERRNRSEYRFQASIVPHALSGAPHSGIGIGHLRISCRISRSFPGRPVRSSWISGSSKNRNAFALPSGTVVGFQRYGAHLSNCARIGQEQAKERQTSKFWATELCHFETASLLAKSQFSKARSERSLNALGINENSRKTVRT